MVLSLPHDTADQGWSALPRDTRDLRFIPPANHPVSGFPLAACFSRHPPPGAATRHLKFSIPPANWPTGQRVNFVSVWSTEPLGLRASNYCSLLPSLPNEGMDLVRELIDYVKHPSVSTDPAFKAGMDGAR